MRLRLLLPALLLAAASLLSARPFTVMVYNVENLHDADGVAAYDEYQAATYKPAHVLTKLRNTTRVLSAVPGGPDIVLLQEIEVDRTPVRLSQEEVLRTYAGTSIEAMLSGEPDARVRDLPAEFLLLKALEDAGLKGYRVVAGEDPADVRHEDGNLRAIKCVVLTRFPVKAVRMHPVVQARHIVEVTLDVDGHELTLFNNHWKSGASDPKTEEIRIQNAGVLRARIDELLKADPNADILIGGDFNSQYNQKRRYRSMERTAINDVLGSQGSELAIRGSSRDLYNLWFELPPKERGSDTFRGEWGTLMQLIVSRGLYDLGGVQYEDGSFAVLRLPGENADGAGMPIRWSGDGPAGRGFSDHLPLTARFRTVSDGKPGVFMKLEREPSSGGDESTEPRRVDHSGIDLKSAVQPDTIPAGANLRDGSWTGKLFWVEGTVVEDRFPRVMFRGEAYDVYSPEKEVRDLLQDQKKSTGRLRFVGELGQFKGRWQFVVRAKEWVR